MIRISSARELTPPSNQGSAGSAEQVVEGARFGVLAAGAVGRPVVLLLGEDRDDDERDDDDQDHPDHDRGHTVLTVHDRTSDATAARIRSGMGTTGRAGSVLSTYTW